jgi:hypothetical protein
MSEASATPEQTYAVVQTGGYTGEAGILMFTDESGKRRPAVLAIFTDESKANRMRKRILSRYNKISRFGDEKLGLLTPILGVVKVTLEPRIKRPRKPKEPSPNGSPIAPVAIPTTPPLTRTAGPVHAKK